MCPSSWIIKEIWRTNKQSHWYKNVRVHNNTFQEYLSKAVEEIEKSDNVLIFTNKSQK